MTKTLWLTCAAVVAAVTLAACGGDDGGGKGRASLPANATSPTRAPDDATRPSSRPAVPNSPASTPVSDGTVDPLGAGSTDPWTVKANPENFSGQAILKDVRMGVHPENGGWERIVFEFEGASRPPAKIEYVASASQCASGQPVSLPGGAVLQVRVAQAVAHDSAGKVTVGATDIKGPGSTILQAKQICDFEGVVTWALGVKGKQNFKVTTLQNPTRLVIDVKQ